MVTRLGLPTHGADVRENESGAPMCVHKEGAQGQEDVRCLTVYRDIHMYRDV